MPGGELKRKTGNAPIVRQGDTKAGGGVQGTNPHAKGTFGGKPPTDLNR